MSHGGKHVRFSASRRIFRGRNQHYLRNGRPKIRFDDPGYAMDVVAQMRKQGKDVQGYLCRECEGWHVGNRRHMDAVPDRDVALNIELGDRAFSHLRAQNGRRTKRSISVTSLAKRAREKALTRQCSDSPARKSPLP